MKRNIAVLVFSTYLLLIVGGLGFAFDLWKQSHTGLTSPFVSTFLAMGLLGAALNVMTLCVKNLDERLTALEKGR